MAEPVSAIVVEDVDGVYTIAFYGEAMTVEMYYDFLMKLKASEDWIWPAIEEGRVSVSTLEGDELRENLHFIEM